ncbi:MAG: Gfo/Idh/MocA family protein, partial [Telluria sp.]
MKKRFADRPAMVGMGSSDRQHAYTVEIEDDGTPVGRRYDRPIRVCLIGTGSIAHTHAEALRALANVAVVAVVDSNAARARAFAAKWTIPHVFRDVDDALAAGTFDAVHVLTPPDSHYALARVCIEGGYHTLVEKPLAVNADEAASLVALAADRNVICAVNQNFVFHPAFAALCARLQANEVGPLRSLMVSYNAPLRQLAARQFSAWMFARPLNILLEQAVHPLSQIVALTGPINGIQASAGASLMLGKDAPFYPSCDAILRSESGVVAHLQFAVGRSLPHWEVRAQCD